MNRLTVVLGSVESQDAKLAEVLEEWSDAHVIDRVAVINTEKFRMGDPVQCRYLSSGNSVETELFDLVTSQIWERVTVVAVRVSRLSDYEASHFKRELEILGMLEASFVDNAATTVRSCTVSIIEVAHGSELAFSPEWGIHLAQEPIVRIDPAVASQPMRDVHRAPLVALLSMTVSGGFVWQSGPLLDDARDPVRGDHKPIRVSRAFLRVVNAGRLTDEILAGAFPPGGPWSVPGDLHNARAVPSGTQVPDSVVAQLRELGSFGFVPLKEKSRPKGTRVGLMDGVKLFFKEFWGALAGIPMSMVATVRGEIEGWVQKVTFGDDSSVLLRFDPLASDFDLDELNSIVEVQGLGDGVEAIGSSLPWELLQKVSFGLVDGGRYPESFDSPTSGVHRLVFTDPHAIGPGPTTSSLELSDAERAILDLPQKMSGVAAMDVATSLSIKERISSKLANPQVDLAAFDVSTPLSNSESSTDSSESSTPEKIVNDSSEHESTKRRRFRRSKRKKEKAAKSLAEGSDSASLPVSEAGNNAEVSPANTGTSSDDTVGPIEHHIPGHPKFVAKNYEFVTRFYQGTRDDLSQRMSSDNSRYEAALDLTRVPAGNWSSTRTCDHCGTKFDHGVLVRHRPSQALIHVGRVCAEKAYGLAAITEEERAVLEALSERLDDWKASQSNSLLWRVGESIYKGHKQASSSLQNAVSIIAQRPVAQQAQSKAREKYRKWTRRGFLVFLLLLGLCIASVFLGPLPLLIFALSLAGQSIVWVVGMVKFARELVRSRYRLARIEDQYERAFHQGRHSISELLRLASVNEQFHDWQAIIREIVHVPFGRDSQFDSISRTVEDIERPAGFVIASAHPDDAQKMRPYLDARSQTMHTGWLSGIRDVLFEEWRDKYINSRLLSPADNILPESDNSSSQSIVGKHPFSNEDVYYPRADLRRRLVGGRLQSHLVEEKSRQIAEDLRRTPIESLIGTVEVRGAGSALSGLPVKEFLNSLAVPPEEPVAFFPDLISDLHPELRHMVPELLLPAPDGLSAGIGSVQVEPGVEFTAATWIVELSPPIGPLAALRAISPSVAPDPSGFTLPDEPSVS